MAIKLGITVLYLTVITVGLIPTVDDRARLGDALLERPTISVDLGRLVVPAGVGPALLVTATVLSVVKPRGRVRRRRDPEAAHSGTVPGSRRDR